MRPHFRAAYNLARWLVREPADAEDVLQEAVMRAFRHFQTIRGERARSWLLTIVRNSCWSFIARRGDAEEVFDEERDAPGLVPLQLVPEPEAHRLRTDHAKRIRAQPAALRSAPREACIPHG